MMKNFTCRCVAIIFKSNSIFAFKTAPINKIFISARRFFFLPLPRLPKSRYKQKINLKNHFNDFHSFPCQYRNGKVVFLSSAKRHFCSWFLFSFLNRSHERKKGREREKNDFSIHLLNCKQNLNIITTATTKKYQYQNHAIND